MQSSTRILLAFGCLWALLGTGCTSTEVTKGDFHMKRTAIFTKNNVSKVVFNPTTGAFEMEGYTNEQTEIAAAVAGSVAKALAPVK